MSIDVQHLAKLARFRSDGMKKVLCAVLAAALACGLCGCNKEEKITSESESSVVSYSETGFDIDRARKSIVVKGQSFEIPKPLKEIKGDWSYKVNNEYCQEGTCHVEVYYKDELMLTGGGENYFEGKAKDAVMYNTTLKTDDCSVDGIVPLKTTRQEVLDKYGDPDSTGLRDSDPSTAKTYKYGIDKGVNAIAGRFNSQCITIGFNEDGIVELVSVTYADLTKEY